MLRLWEVLGPVRRRLRFSASDDGQRTSETSPPSSSNLINRAVESSCPRSTPCRAERGMEWWRLCQLSPIESTAKGAKFVARSLVRVVKGRDPQMWQAELIAKVACWRRNTLTSPAQMNAPMAPDAVPVTAQPMSVGAPREKTQRSGKSRSITTRSGSASRSGAQRFTSVGWPFSSQPTWECHPPRALDQGPLPARYGEWGSPGRSV